jgi:hypothetical protein
VLRLLAAVVLIVDPRELLASRHALQLDELITRAICSE